MSIDFDKFLNWAESRFDDVVVRGDEIKLNSIFCEDRKHHLWCNPSGGKKGSDQGVYHCWKTDNKGSLLGLVTLVDQCTYEEALETLDAVSDRSLLDLERRVQEIFEKAGDSKAIDEETVKGLDLPPDCYLFDELPSSHYLKRAAEEYLKSRKIPSDTLLICTRGRYKNRIVIPYRDRDGGIIYYNGRYIGDPGTNLRYLGPPKELGIGKGDVLYVPKWPRPGEKLYVTEGEFDAISLFHCGFQAAALGGKVLSDKQTGMINQYSIVLCLDADDSGGEALPKIANSLLQKGLHNISYVRPCKEYKDWNGMLVEKGDKILREYVRTQERPYNDSSAIGDWESTKIAMNKIVR